MDPVVERGRPTPSRSAWLAVVVLLCTTAASLFFLARERKHTRELAASREEMSATLTQARSQIESLSAKVDILTAASLAAKQAPALGPARAAARNRQRSPAAAVVRPVEDARWKQVQSRLSEQEKEIAAAREEVGKTREDLAGRLDSTRDELSGSIARTHEELVTLQRRGERTYHEFRIRKSKEFQKVGPLSLSLRKVNYKRRSYDLNMIVDDIPLQKKGMNLYEPVLISLSDRPQPLQLVVNRMTKDEVQGYLSEPRFKNAELAAAPPAGSALQDRHPAR